MKASDFSIGIMVGIPFNTDVLLFLIKSDRKINEFVIWSDILRRPQKFVPSSAK